MASLTKYSKAAKHLVQTTRRRTNYKQVRITNKWNMRIHEPPEFEVHAADPSCRFKIINEVIHLIEGFMRLHLQ